MASNFQAKWGTLIGWFLIGILQYSHYHGNEPFIPIFSLSCEIQIEQNTKGF